MPTAAVAIIGAGAILLAACSSGTTKAKGAAGAPAATTTKSGGPAAEFLTLKGVSTAVDLDAGTLKVLTDNKVSVAPVAPATVSSTGGVTTANFPISQGFVSVYPTTTPDYVRGTFSHTGGLQFSAGGKSLKLTDFIVNPGDSTLTATVAGGAAAQIIDLDGSALKITTDGQGNTHLDGTVAKLSAGGASALNKYFGVNLFSGGIVLGVVHITATGTSGPKGAPSAEFLTLKGTSTNVDLDAATLKVLTDNKVSVAPVAPATVSGATASFPITQGYVAVYPATEASYIRGTFSHSGGLTFSAGGKTLQLTDFIVNPGDSTLTATVAGGAAAPIIDLDGSAVKISTDSQGNTHLDGTIAKLSAVGASALNKYFGVNLFSGGIVLGVVHITATGDAAPKA